MPVCEKLTSRENEVLGLMAEGLSNRQIAEKLFLSTHTVTSYTKNIYRKLNVENRLKAVAKAIFGLG